ncbi:MAG: hypothetical protein LH616_08340 [Ilumatobacteraceae bacterium]|nr:hypothetical protein [Ilumatobacteraceae bacterium]
MATDPLLEIQARLREHDARARPAPAPAPSMPAAYLDRMRDASVQDSLRAVADFLASLEAHQRLYAHEIIRRTIN